MRAVDAEKRLLLEGQWAPVTDTVLFINRDARMLAQLLTVGGEGHGPLSNNFAVAGEVHGDLSGLLTSLLPLDSSAARRMLFLPTKAPNWTAMVTSSWRGQDNMTPGIFFAGKIPTVTITNIINSAQKPNRNRRYGVRQISQSRYQPDGTQVGHTLAVGTWIGGWKVHVSKLEFPDGNIWHPDAPRVPDRFTHDDLVAMAARFGLRPFDEDFYAPDGWGILVARTGFVPPNIDIGVTLAEARGEVPRSPFYGEPGFIPASERYPGVPGLN